MKKLISIFGTLATLGVVMGLIIWTGGFLDEKILPGLLAAETRDLKPERTVLATREMIEDDYEAVGTIRPRTETTIESQVTGRVISVHVDSGQMVKKGDPLITLDSREVTARLEKAREGINSAQAREAQAEQAVSAAEAEFIQARDDYRRFMDLYAKMAATIREKQAAESNYHRTRANLERARQGLVEAKAGVQGANQQVEEARVALSYTDLRALEGAQVVKRLAEPGDTAWPGKPLLVLQTGGSLRLEALVREGLIARIAPGHHLKVVIDAVGRTLDGIVEEVVPSADPQTRTFLVKVKVDQVPGLFPGMFGRLLVPVGEREVVLAPEEAIRRVGQLETVTVKENGIWREIFVRTGQTRGDRVEILSGLSGGETLAVGLWK